MKALPISIRRIGNSLGVVIPKTVLAQVGMMKQAELTVEGDVITLRKPQNPVRTGWAEAARKLATHEDDTLLMGEFSNCDDAELVW